MSHSRELPELSCLALQSAIRNNPHAGLSNSELEHLSNCDFCMEILIEQGLTSAPQLSVSGNFAADLCARLPIPSPTPLARRPRRVTGFAISCAVLLILACAGSLLFASMPHGWLPPGWLGVAIEYVLVVEIFSLALWLGGRRTLPR